MKHRKYKPDLSEWGIEALEEVGKAVETGLRKAMAEALHYAFEDDETYIYFPVECSKEPDEKRRGTDGLGGPEVSDPLTVYLRVGLEGYGEKPTYEFNLRGALADSIEACANDGSFSAGLGRLSVALRALADEIDAARAKSNAKLTCPPRGQQEQR